MSAGAAGTGAVPLSSNEPRGAPTPPLLPPTPPPPPLPPLPPPQPLSVVVVLVMGQVTMVVVVVAAVDATAASGWYTLAQVRRSSTGAMATGSMLQPWWSSCSGYSGSKMDGCQGPHSKWRDVLQKGTGTGTSAVACQAGFVHAHTLVYYVFMYMIAHSQVPSGPRYGFMCQLVCTRIRERAARHPCAPQLLCSSCAAATAHTRVYRSVLRHCRLCTMNSTGWQ